MKELNRQWHRRWSVRSLKVRPFAEPASAHADWPSGASRASARCALLAVLFWGCTGDAEPNSQTLSACERYCALRDFCSQRSETCESECGWVDQTSNERHPACAEARLLDCAVSETKRIECAADALTIDLTACPEHEPGSSCAVGFQPAQGAFQVTLEDSEQGTCSLSGLTAQVGAAESPQGAQADGLQAFLKQLGEEQVVIPDLFVRCTLMATDEGFEVALALRAGAQSLELLGQVASSGSGTAAVSYTHDLDSATLNSASEAPCSVDVRPSPSSSDSLALSESFIWADIQCPQMQTQTSSEDSCAAVGALLFENCSQL